MALTNEKSEIESKFRESHQDQNRFEAAKARMAQENALLKQHNDWLNEELGQKSTVLLEDRKKASVEIVDLKTKVVDLEGELEEKARGQAAAQKQLGEVQGKLAERESECLELKQKMSSQEALFEKEIGTAKRLIGLYQDTAEKGTGKVKELEGIVEELQAHMKQAAKASDERVAEAEQKAAEAEQRAADHKAQLDRNLEAASHGVASTRVSLGAETPASSASQDQIRRAGDAAMQMLEMSPAAAAATMLKDGMSLTEMYSKYVEMSDAWRQERSDKKRVQGYLDTILEELERKAPLINEQKQEYERVMRSHDALAKRLEDAMHERAALDATIGKARSDAQRAAREKRSVEQQAEDLSRQVQVLLKEVEDLKSGRALVGSRGNGAGAGQTSSNGGVVRASDVINDHLVEFKSIEELQQKNKQLLAVARQLGDDNEQKVSDVRKSLEEEHAKQIAAVELRAEKLSQQHKQHEGLMQQVLRQRDLYKQLLSEREGEGGGEVLAAEISADISSGAKDHKALYVDLQKEHEEFKQESAKNLQMLRDEGYKYREEAGVARGEKTQLQAQLEFERERHARLNEVCGSQGREIEGLVQRNASLIQKLTQHEQRIKDLSFDLDVSRDDLRRESERNASLAAEKELLAKSEKRLTAEVTQAVAEKHRQQASAESLIQRYGEQEKDWARERERLLQESQQMRESWASAQKQLLEESGRSRDALSASTNLAADTAARIATLEVELRGATKGKEDLQRQLDSAVSNVESLKASLQKAEEKAALAVMRSAAAAQEAAQTAAGEAGSEPDAISRLKAQLKDAQEDAGSAQEAAAAAAGHLAQYKAMCSASDEALKAMKEAHEGYKQESAAAAAAAQKELEAARAKLSEMEAEVSKKRGVDAAEEKKRLAEEEALIAENTRLKEEAASVRKEMELTAEKVSTLEGDVKEHHQQWRAAKSLYDNELIAHAADVKRLGSLESDVEKAKGEAREAKTERDAAKVESAKIQADKATVEAKVEELRRQNRILHEQLEQAAAKGPAEEPFASEGTESGAGEIQQVVQYLRKEKETADCQLSLVNQENARLRKQVEYANQRADAADQRLEAVRKEEVDDERHEKVLRDVESLNLLRESNSGLREENMKLQAQVKDLNKARAGLDEAMAPLKRKCTELQALVDSKDDEVKSIKEQSSRWETRTQNLLDKYGQVDLGEYQRVVKALAEAEKARDGVDKRVKAAAKAAKEDAAKELAEIKGSLEKAKNQEAIAKKQIFNIFNPTRLSVPQWKQERDATKKKIEELEASNAKLKTQLSSEADKAKALAAEVENTKTAKEELQLKVLEKLKNAKQLRITLQQKVKALEKKVKEQDAEGVKEVEEAPKTPKAKKAAAKKRDRESPAPSPKKKPKKPQAEQQAAQEEPAGTVAVVKAAGGEAAAEAEQPAPMEPKYEAPTPADVDNAAEATDEEGSPQTEAAEEQRAADEPAAAAVEEPAATAGEEEQAMEETPDATAAAAAAASAEASLNPQAAPFTPTKAVEAPPQGEEAEGAEEAEDAEEAEQDDEATDADAPEADQAGDMEDSDAEELEGEEEAEPEPEPKPASASKPKPISWKGGKKKEKAPVVAKKAAAAAVKATKVARKKIVKKKVAKKKE